MTTLHLLVHVNLPVPKTQLSGERSDSYSVLGYEKLHVYRLALRFVADTLSLKDLFSRGHAALIDQFHSASISVVLNIAEGAGKFKTADKQRFYAIDRGSAMECGALLDIFSLLKIIDKKQHCSQKDTLVRIVSMLTSLCLSRRQ